MLKDESADTDKYILGIQFLNIELKSGIFVRFLIPYFELNLNATC